MRSFFGQKEVVLYAIRDAMEEWLDSYRIQIESNQPPAADPVATALESVRAQLAGLQHQQGSIFVYTIDM